MCLTLKLIEDFHNCKKGAGPEGRNLESGNALRSLSVAEIASGIKERCPSLSFT